MDSFCGILLLRIKPSQEFCRYYSKNPSQRVCASLTRRRWVWQPIRRQRQSGDLGILHESLDRGVNVCRRDPAAVESPNGLSFLRSLLLSIATFRLTFHI